MKQLPIEKGNFLGDRLRELRLIFGFKQADIANSLNVSRSTYSYYEEGKTRPDPAVLAKLSNYYDVPIDYFYQEVINVNVSLHDSAGKRRRTSRIPALEMEKVGELRPLERSLILLLRSNGIISTQDVLDSLEYRLKQIREEEEKGKI